VNNILTVLNTLLKKAIEWGDLSQMPCTIRLLKVPKTPRTFLDFEEHEGLLDATGHEPVEARLVTLLGGESRLALWRDEGGPKWMSKCGHVVSARQRRFDVIDALARRVACDQCLFLRSRPAFDLPLSLSKAC
jgi:hypothetical protein